MRVPKVDAEFFFRVAFVSVLLLVATMFLGSAAEHGIVSPVLDVWCNRLSQGLGAIGAVALFGSLTCIVVESIKKL